MIAVVTPHRDDTVTSRFPIIATLLTLVWAIGRPSFAASETDALNIVGNDLLFSNFVGEIEVDNEVVTYNEVSIHEDRVVTRFGDAERVVRIAKSDKLTHTLTLLRLSNPSSTYIATHSFAFKQDVNLDGVTETHVWRMAPQTTPPIKLRTI